MHDHLQSESENNFIEWVQQITHSMTHRKQATNSGGERKVRGELTVWGEKQVRGEQTVGGAGGVKLGESVYFNKSIEAKLASVYPTFCSQLCCSYTYQNRSAEQVEIDTNTELMLMAEGTISCNFTYNKGQINQSSTLLLAMITIADEPKSIAKALNRPDKGAAEWWKSVCEEMKSWEALQAYTLVDEDELRKLGVEKIDSKVVVTCRGT